MRIQLMFERSTSQGPLSWEALCPSRRQQLPRAPSSPASPARLGPHLECGTQGTVSLPPGGIKSVHPFFVRRLCEFSDWLATSAAAFCIRPYTARRARLCWGPGGPSCWGGGLAEPPISICDDGAVDLPGQATTRKPLATWLPGPRQFVPAGNGATCGLEPWTGRRWPKAPTQEGAVLLPCPWLLFFFLSF